MDPAPPSRLRVIVFGGHVAASAVTRLVSAMEWEPLVAAGPDGLESMLPNADAIVILEHDLSLAGPALAAALRSDIDYIGAMGNRATQAARHEHLQAAGFTDAQLTRIHGPAGLDLGAESPSEIALAILAEIVALHRGVATNRHLSDQVGPIHAHATAGADYCPET